VDIHAVDSLSEIRGQVNLTTGIGMTAQLSAAQDVPPTVISNGTGTASVVVSPDRQSISYSLTFLDLTSNIAAAGGHFHVGAKGVNGILVKTIVPPNSWGAASVNGVWSMSDRWIGTAHNAYCEFIHRRGCVHQLAYGGLYRRRDTRAGLLQC